MSVRQPTKASPLMIQLMVGVLSGGVRGCSVVLGYLGMSPPAQNCAIPRAALMP